MIERAEAWLHLSPGSWAELLIIVLPIALLLAVATEVGRSLTTRH